jgi:hypothetical protein
MARWTTQPIQTGLGIQAIQPLAVGYPTGYVCYSGVCGNGGSELDGIAKMSMVPGHIELTNGFPSFFGQRVRTRMNNIDIAKRSLSRPANSSIDIVEEYQFPLR